MNYTNIAFILALGLVTAPLSASAQSNDKQADEECLVQAIKKQDRQDRAESNQKSEQLNLELNKKVIEIFKSSDPKTKAAFKKALLAWVAYEKAMGQAVEISYTEGGGNGGEKAATHCNLTTGEDFLKILNQFFAK
ncbi:hypothetical protein [Aristophania vespae]|uniref:hypothetical protein n=1 Tax=Aristophania vespae TaxID=2697033 RepID=UPI0023514A34|nr:hypothetical protein [Aristophania vespae]